MAAVVLAAAAAACAAPAAGGRAGRVLHVAPGGSDRGPGTAPSPFRTIAHALGELAPGDTLVVAGGTYDERIRNPEIRPGREDAPIRVVAAEGERPVIRGLLWLRSPSWWSIEGIGVTWSDQNEGDEHMVKLVDGTGWQLVGSELWGARSPAALLVAGTSPGEPSGWRVAGNCVHGTVETNGTNQDQLVYVDTGLDAGPGLVERNLLFDAPNGSGVKLGGPDPDEGGAADVTVRHNTVHGAAQGVLVAWRSHSNTVTGNLLGDVGPGYGAVRGYQLTGRDNVAEGNAAFGAATFLLNDDGYPGVADGGNRLLGDPGFDSTASCDGFHPADPDAARFGRWAP